MHQEINRQFQHLLNNLQTEIKAYPTEAALWTTSGTIKNSGGTLCYHLYGNLQAFIGQGMGQTGYIRNRPLEFSIRNVPKAELLNKIKETATMIDQVIPTLDLSAPFLSTQWNLKLNHGEALLRLLWHLSWHLGQINYHRRILAT